MPLKILIDGTSVKDLTALKGMNLETFRFYPKQITKGIEVLRSMKSLKTIIADPGPITGTAAEFWKRYDAGEFK